MEFCIPSVCPPTPTHQQFPKAQAKVTHSLVSNKCPRNVMKTCPLSRQIYTMCSWRQGPFLIRAPSSLGRRPCSKSLLILYHRNSLDSVILSRMSSGSLLTTRPTFTMKAILPQAHGPDRQRHCALPSVRMHPGSPPPTPRTGAHRLQRWVRTCVCVWDLPLSGRLTTDKLFNFQVL